MSSSPSIQHPGIIERIEGETVKVRIEVSSACSACHAQGICSLSEKENKIVEIKAGKNNPWSQGDRVMVVMDRSLGPKALVLGYLLPLGIVLTSLFVGSAFMDHEMKIGLMALLMLVPYYGILFACRAKIKKFFRFSIESHHE